MFSIPSHNIQFIYSSTVMSFAADLVGSYAYTDTLKGIYYGPSCTKTALPKLLDRIGGQKALVVTGRTLYNKVLVQTPTASHTYLLLLIPATQTNVVRVREDILKERNAHAATFFEIGEHSPVADIKKGVQIFKESGADIIVSVGGGSPIDASKAILHLLHQETGGPFLRQIAIPTTLSAAEYTASRPARTHDASSLSIARIQVGAGYTNEEGSKIVISSPELAPAGIILDAELTLATPERLWLSSGLRALDHAVGTPSVF